MSRLSAARCSGWTATSWTPPSAPGLRGAPNRPPADGGRWPSTARTVRGSADHGTGARHLLAAIDYRTGVVIGQVGVDGKTNEIPMFSQLMELVEGLTDVVVTGDALEALPWRDAHPRTRRPVEPTAGWSSALSKW